MVHIMQICVRDAMALKISNLLIDGTKKASPNDACSSLLMVRLLYMYIMQSRVIIRRDYNYSGQYWYPVLAMFFFSVHFCFIFSPFYMH